MRGTKRALLADRVCAFFMANPDEELLTADVAVKFDAPRSAVTHYLAIPVNRGLLKLERSPTGTSFVYTAGPALTSARA